MMNEWNTKKGPPREHSSIDERLTVYYGPALREQPLSSSSWQRVRSRLGSQRAPSPQFVQRWRLRLYRGHRTTPAFIQNAFSHIAYEARLPYSPFMLSCAYKFRAHVPRVRVSLLSKRSIRLALPANAVQTVEPAMLDVLLATGLARYLCLRKPTYAASRLLLSSAIPLVWVTLIVLWLHNISLYVFPIAITTCIIVCAVTLWLLHMQGRRMALQADTLMVQWLGRGRACQGLHTLADRSRRPSRVRWSGLSLTERIRHVCGTQVAVEHERLTLVR